VPNREVIGGIIARGCGGPKVTSWPAICLLDTRSDRRMMRRAFLSPPIARDMYEFRATALSKAPCTSMNKEALWDTT
jgi:hypothetical protein